MTLPLDDPRLAQLLTDMVDRRVRAAIDGMARIRYGVVAAVDPVTKTAALYLGGSTAPSPGFVYEAGSPPAVGDRVRAVNRGADRYIEANLTQDPSPVGFQTLAPRWLNTQTFASTNTLAAAGGALAIPIVVAANMHLAGYRFWSADAGAGRGVEIRLYLEDEDTASPLVYVPGTHGSVSWTPTVAAMRGVGIAATMTLRPGAYVAVMRNTHASNGLGVGHAGGSSANYLGQMGALQASGQAALGATIDISTWGGTGAFPSLMLVGAAGANDFRT